MEISSHSLEHSLTEGQQTDKGIKSLCRRLYPTGFYREFKANLNIAWGIVFTQVCFQSTQPIATMFGGHLGKLELDAVGLSNTIINISGTSIAVGTSTACYTVFSQTYGAKNYKLLGVLLQRSVILVMLTILPCYALHLNLESILILLGQNPDVAKLAGEYLVLYMPGLFCSFLMIILRSYAQSQNVVVPLFIIGLVSVVTGVAMQYILLFVVGWGIRMERSMSCRVGILCQTRSAWFADGVLRVVGIRSNSSDGRNSGRHRTWSADHHVQPQQLPVSNCHWNWHLHVSACRPDFGCWQSRGREDSS